MEVTKTLLPFIEEQAGIPSEDIRIECVGDKGDDGRCETSALGGIKAVACLCPGRDVRITHEEYGGAVFALGLHASIREKSSLLWNEQARHSCS